MDPFTIMALGSTALSAIGKLAGGFVNSSLDKVQQSIANENTNLLVKRSQLETQAGELPLDEARLEQSRLVNNINRTLGAETGKFTASNIDPTYGSPLLLEGFSAGQAAQDMALIGAKGLLGHAQALGQAAGTLAQAAGSAGQAAAFGMKATGDVVSGIFGAGTALLSGLSGLKGIGSPFGSTPGGTTDVTKIGSLY